MKFPEIVVAAYRKVGRDLPTQENVDRIGYPAEVVNEIIQLQKVNHRTEDSKYDADHPTE